MQASQLQWAKLPPSTPSSFMIKSRHLRSDCNSVGSYLASPHSAVFNSLDVFCCPSEKSSSTLCLVRTWPGWVPGRWRAMIMRRVMDRGCMYSVLVIDSCYSFWHSPDSALPKGFEKRHSWRAYDSAVESSYRIIPFVGMERDTNAIAANTGQQPCDGCQSYQLNTKPPQSHT